MAVNIKNQKQIKVSFDPKNIVLPTFSDDPQNAPSPGQTASGDQSEGADSVQSIANVSPSPAGKPALSTTGAAPLTDADLAVPTSKTMSKLTEKAGATPKERKKLSKALSAAEKKAQDAKKKAAEQFSPEALDAALREDNLPLEGSPDALASTTGDGGSVVERDANGMPIGNNDAAKRFRASPEGTEYRRKQVQRLLLRGVPRVAIANYLGVSIDTIHSDVKFINAAMRQEMQNFDYPMYIGQSLSFYDECKLLAMRLANDNKEKSNGVKMTAVRTALEAEKAKHELLKTVGLFKIVAPTDPFNAINTGRQGAFSDENDLGSFMQLIAKAATGEVDLTTIDVQATVVESTSKGAKK